MQPSVKAERSSNLELLRILAMFLIVAHHSVVNSGVMESFSTANLNGKWIFLQLWGMWGKTAINLFVMISGYFMCTSRLTWRRFGKLYIQVKFYRFGLFVLLALAGYQAVTATSLLKLGLGVLHGVNSGFTSSFLAFYCLIPFYNAMIEKLGASLWKLVAALLVLFTVSTTFFYNTGVFHYVFWYMTVYFVAAWLRLYPSKWSESRRFTGLVFALSVGLSYASVLSIDALGYFLHRDFSLGTTYYFVADSNKLLALVVGVSGFLFVKNCRIRQSVPINRVAATCFGILLIHGNSDAMRQWLWKDFLDISGKLTLPLPALMGFMVGIAAAIFAVCSLLDTLRIYLVERPLFALLERKAERIEATAKGGLARLKQSLSRLGSCLERFV